MLLRYVTINVHAKISLNSILQSTKSWFLLSFLFTMLKNKSFSSFQQQFFLMSKVEQLVVKRRNYEQYCNSFFGKREWGRQSFGAYTSISVSISCWIHHCYEGLFYFMFNQQSS